ncbi:MAG: ROK family glucokinase [Candidatus Nanopelagicales bacterium]
MGLTLGVDVGGTKILGGVVDEDGVILATTRRPTPRNDAAAVVQTIVDVVEELRADHEVEAIGVGVAGLVDADRSRVIFATNLGWAQEPLRADIESRTGLPAVIENDGNVAAWGEFRFGAGRDLDDMVAVTVGTGIGGGLVLDGRLRRGAIGVAAEIGHMNAVPDGRPCGCGRNGCWEQYASGNALVREARMLAADRRPEAGILLGLGDGTPEGVQGLHVTEAARAGDPVALEAFRIVGVWLGRGLADLAASLDPRAFVVGGGVSEAGDLLLVSARQTLGDKIIGADYRQPPPIRVAELGNRAGLAGAADLARHRD